MLPAVCTRTSVGGDVALASRDTIYNIIRPEVSTLRFARYKAVPCRTSPSRMLTESDRPVDLWEVSDLARSSISHHLHQSVNSG
jgi:hypothetical protein